MKFIDKNGVTHDTYFGAVFSSISSKMSNVMSSKKFKSKKDDDIFSDDVEFGYSMEDNGIYDQDDAIVNSSEEDMRIPSLDERSDLFIPGTTPRIPCTKKHAVVIDYDNHQLHLKDENGNTIHTANIDSRLMDCPTKDLINMVYDVKSEKATSEDNK